MTLGRLQAGWRPPHYVLKQLAVDEAILAEDDDTSQS
jgi:hypothetical protein